nr:MAG TPA_asm: hypothetical protein [Caudoviricetes sp.]
MRLVNSASLWPNSSQISSTETPWSRRLLPLSGKT